MQELVLTFEAILLVSLRVVPTLAFAAPFTLLRIPPLIRILVGLALALVLVGGRQGEILAALAAGSSLVTIAAGELLIGGAIALCLQLAFGAILWAGGAVDIQAGFGLAMVADPTTQAQMPLAGTIFVYAAAAVFCGMGGMFDLLALWSASLDILPFAASTGSLNPVALAMLLSAVFLIATGLFGLVMLVIFLLDVAIAFMSRTLPQMNVLLLGFQIKSMAMLVTLPITVAISGALILRLLRIALETAPGLVVSGSA
ncbi:flagellar biosynthetic protein FliR [Pelagerythrobacter marensis]|uniref:Flagellar biosynthetic protein FliR n=1 Tax=Pelagerythrobacter marensis TaxID=543877 RepID=A0A0G3XC50_9SPHN|nr:flagellar biosynthetic protein FliR [Pelagerythrobacter marensis]AKM07983.1 Flagellar biosynthetic protein FliR [Pelagerythrobacter marensis]